MTDPHPIGAAVSPASLQDSILADREDAAEAARTLPDDFVDQLYDADPEETRE